MELRRALGRGRARGIVAVAGLAIIALVATACTQAAPTPVASSTSTTGGGSSEQALAIAKIVKDAMVTESLKAVIVQVKVGDKIVTTQAFGDSMTGVPATTDMNFRNGAVAFEYVSNLLLQYVDSGTVKLDDTINAWVPELPESDKVTLRMLTNQTSGYPDYEASAAFTAAYNANPFHEFTYDERIAYAFATPPQFPPGTNWSYAHTNFMILGHILAMIGGQSLDQLLQAKVLTPLGLTHTHAFNDATIPEPALHSFTSERRVALGIPAGTAFTEESSYWNPVWGTPIGAAQTTTIDDMTTTAIATGTGALLSDSSFHEMTDSKLIGFGEKVAACGNSCFTQRNAYNYGLGIVRSGSWMLQNPLLSGYSAVAAYLPSGRIAISVAATFEPGAFDANGIYGNSADTVFRKIGAYLAPNDPPPTK